jgi:hypothetical protein
LSANQVTGLSITRKEFQEISESFPALLDALEKYAMDKLDGVDLGVIEWYHRLRNELYHQGNGLTVERDKVQIYAQLANQLFKNIFGVELVASGTIGAELLGEFMTAWFEVERFLNMLQDIAVQRAETGGVGVVVNIRLPPSDIPELDELRTIRNEIVHGVPGSEELLTRTNVDRVLRLAHRLRLFVASRTQTEKS